MGTESLVHFKASLSCHIPAYVVDSGEILRALPAHILRRRYYGYTVDTANESLPVSKFQSKGRSFAPKTPSPLRQSMAAEIRNGTQDVGSGTGECNDNAGIGAYYNHVFALATTDPAAVEQFTGKDVIPPNPAFL